MATSLVAARVMCMAAARGWSGAVGLKAIATVQMAESIFLLNVRLRRRKGTPAMVRDLPLPRHFAKSRKYTEPLKK